jgi:hypothetical protein
MPAEAVYSGLEPGQLAYVGYTPESEGSDCIGQCVPFNPFSDAFDHDRFVWGIVLCEKGKAPDALRPRRIYANDSAMIVETIEGLAAYPEEWLQESQSNLMTLCQTIVKQGSVERTDYYNGEPVAHYWQHFWEYSGSSWRGEMSLHFKVPIEYIDWGGRIEEIIPARDTYTRTVSIELSTSSSNGSINTPSPTYNFPTPQCVTGGLQIKQAGRF